MPSIETDIIYCGDCLRELKRLPDNSVDLIYLDPPFFSQKNYEDFWIKDKVTKTGFSDADWERMRQTIDPVILQEYEHLEERWKGGRKGIYVYIAYMKERLVQCERVLKKTGSIYLHCDRHAGHYLKVMMDQIFGYDNFQNEIIWHYRGRGMQKHRFQRKHDTILLYSKDHNKMIFKDSEVKVPLDPNHISRYNKIDDDGKKYALIKKRDGEYSQIYLKEDGIVMDDVWDLPFIHGDEAIGYPTQKPEALLERIIKASSNEGDIVLDPFCGCGTSLAVAKRLNRRFIGIDISRTGCDVTRTRLGGSVRVVGGETLAELKAMEPHDFARLMIQEKLGGAVNPRKTGDMGIDGWLDYKTVPVQVKRWGHSVGRPEVDKFRTAVARDGKRKGLIVAFKFSRDAFVEAARSTDDCVDITLMKVSEALRGAGAQPVAAARGEEEE
jgi:DNA modification methylase